MGQDEPTTEYDSSRREDVLARAFSRALGAAAAFEGATAPNPPVGCVLLDASGTELAAAAHRKAGELHAEALAIRTCREEGTAERIHTAVVTLEPCNHTGRTPPCTEAILATPAREVWIGTRDPNGSVPGQGVERLQKAGLTVRLLQDLQHPEAPRLLAACKRLAAPFAKRARTGLPWVTVKQALTPDGSMIPPPGRKTFTSQSSLALAHRLRKRADAILTGSGTVLADAPEFTIRHVPDFPGKRRWLVILDRRSRVPAAYLEAARRRGFEVLVERSLPEALGHLGEAGALEVLVEAGPALTRHVLNSGTWNEHCLIRQGAGPQGADQVQVRASPSTHPIL